MTFIPYGRQCISEDEIESVERVLRSDWLTQGPTIQLFEETVARYCGADHAIAICNATAALHLACKVLGLGEGDSLWTCTNTFVASANVGLLCGAKVDFIDIDPLTYNMSVSALRKKLEHAAKINALPKILMPVHFSGNSCEMEAIRELADKYQCHIIEDASHALGSSYQGKPVGCCQYSDMAIFSFHAVKIIATGEGGMVATNNKEYHEKLKLLRSHGVTRNEADMNKAPDGPWYYQQVALGFNYRLTEVQAALGCSQMKRIQEFLARRRTLVQRYQARLSALPVILPQETEQAESSWHLYVIQVAQGQGLPTREQVYHALVKKGIGVNVHYIPVHTQPYYQSLGFANGDFPEAEAYYQRAITLPLYPNLTDEQQDYICGALEEIYQQAWVEN